MSYNTWTPLAVSSETHRWQKSAWRIVEAQHVASTMKIVDTQNEQDLLETLLEASKPVQLNTAKALDYLLATPFRYDPLRGGSRFRAATDPGVFYGAVSVRTASAELGYWRWRFLKDAVDLVRLEPVAHTAFRVEIDALSIDLRKPPFNAEAGAWTHKSDYSATQAIAGLARKADIQAIVYLSVRDPQPSWCIAVLTPEAFSQAKSHPKMQTWWLAVRQDEVNWRRENESMTFSTATW